MAFEDSSTTKAAHQTAIIDVNQHAEKATDLAEVARLAGQADALGALLSVIQFIPSDARPSVLLTCASLAEEFTLDLTALIGGAA